jgi:hypothetical protein
VLGLRGKFAEVVNASKDSVQFRDAACAVSPLQRRGRGEDSYARIVNDGFVKASGADVFAHPCRMGLEGIVSKKIDSPFRSGRSGHWIKV